MNIQGTTTIQVLIEDGSQVGHARRTATMLAQQAGMDEIDVGRVALVTTELATNLLKHAGHGALHLRQVPGTATHGIEVVAIDRGPGFSLADCLPDGVSTQGTHGIGLGAVSRQAQVFDMWADERGAAVLARMYPRHAAAGDIRFGITQLSLNDDPACGDGWAIAFDDTMISVLVVDGLGHGPEAEHASQAAVAAFGQDAFAMPTAIMGNLHASMSGTRGGAAAVMQFDSAKNKVAFSGIGNIGATLVSGESTRGLASHPGIVGGQIRKVQAFDYPQVASQLLVMYSDGLQSRWNLRDYPGLWRRHPALIAAILHRDYSRGRDDVTVLALVLEAQRG
ncbi:MAG: ATP-binding protein [Dyella sp.]